MAGVSDDIASDWNSFSHSLQLAKQLKEQKDSKVLCDMTVNIEEHEFVAHRCVLAACSPYFESMFRSELNESKCGLVKLQCTSVNGMRAILDYMYTGDISLTLDNVEDIIQGADHLIMANLKTLCGRFLAKHITIRNCFDLKGLAELYGLSELQNSVQATIECGLNEMLKEADKYLMNLSADEVQSLVSNDKIKVREAELFEFVIKWSKQDKTRQEKLPALLDQIRFVDIQEKFMQQLLGKIDDEELKGVIQGAKKKSLPAKVEDSQSETESALLKPRQSRLVDVIFTWDELLMGTEPFGFVVQDGNWSPLPGLKEGLLSTFVMDNKLITLSSQHRLPHIYSYCYDPLKNQWKPIAKNESSHFGGSAAVVANKLYVFGGVSNSVEMYDPENNCWAQRSASPGSTYSTAVALNDRYIYAIPGGDGQVMDCYDTCNDSWETIESEAFTRLKEDVSSQIWPPLIVKTADAIEITKLGIYKITISTKTREINCEESHVPQIPEDYAWKAGPSVCDVEGDIFVCGGRTKGAKYPAAYMFECSKKTWKELPSQPGQLLCSKTKCALLEMPFFGFYGPFGYHQDDVEEDWYFDDEDEVEDDMEDWNEDEIVEEGGNN
ncbi:kelch-like protein 11 [Glandiceps talaboti]